MRSLILALLLAAPLCAADIYLSPTGSDTPGGGTLAAPFATLAYAHSQSSNGDKLILRAGTYTGGVYMTRNNLTVESYTGEWATIVLPNGTSGQDVTLYFAGSGCTARRLEIVGGYFYCVKIDAGPALVEDCRIHGSGRDCVKIPGADNVTIRRCEIYDSGLRDPSNAEGIDNVNGDYMLVQDCYIHDIATNGLYPKGGSIGSIIERCLIRNCGQKGISMAQSSGSAFYDTVANPEYYGCRDCIARNNIIENCEGSGIDLEAALRARVYNNTLINVAKSQQGGIRISLSSFGGSPPDVPCHDCEIRNNIIVLGSASARPMLFMGNNSHTGTLTMSNNRYYKMGGTAVYWWEPTGQYGLNLAGWKSASGTDTNSTEGDPQVGADWHLLVTSPCIGAAMTIAGFTDDYDGNTRSGAWDIGADESGGTALQTPPPTGTLGTGGTGSSTPLPGTPGAPTSLAQTFNGNVNLTWNDNSIDETNFRIERRGYMGAWGTLSTVGANVTSYTDGSPILGINDYRVFAYNAAGDSLPSNVVTVSLSSAGPPTNATEGCTAQGDRGFSVTGVVLAIMLWLLRKRIHVQRRRIHD